MIISDSNFLGELDEQKPPTAPGLLSKQEKDLLIERTFVGLYRWYVSRSQKTRNWNPNTDFDWRSLRTDHSAELNTIVEGFFAVEQYVPDYVLALLKVIRRSYGRSHFHIRWGAEEEKHSDLWENAILFSRFRSPQWLEEYKHVLRAKEWQLPWDNALHMIFYTVIQERATQVNYLNAGLIAAGKNERPEFAQDQDPVLAQVSQVIAVDEAAHYNFFLEGARLFLYYYPAQSLDALYDVIKFFAMPAGELIPDYDHFAEVVARSAVYGPREHIRDVLDIALAQMGINGRLALRNGIKRIRQVPRLEDGNMVDTAIFDVLDYKSVTKKVQQLFGRIETYEKNVGFDLVYPTNFVASGLEP
jgi:acyl-[acyl-carrier-protein] desaturase